MRLLSKKGFTLIELLVVIAVLGVLAAAIVAAINPIAKINQAKDSTIKSDISQIASAMQAYYTNQAGTATATYPTSVLALVNAEELKTEPKIPGTTTPYSVVTNTGCTGLPAAPCTAVAVYAPDTSTTSNLYICWDSTNNVVKTTSASVPTAAAPTCPN